MLMSDGEQGGVEFVVYGAFKMLTNFMLITN